MKLYTDHLILQIKVIKKENSSPWSLPSKIIAIDLLVGLLYKEPVRYHHVLLHMLFQSQIELLPCSELLRSVRVKYHLVFHHYFLLENWSYYHLTRFHLLFLVRFFVFSKDRPTHPLIWRPSCGLVWLRFFTICYGSCIDDQPASESVVLKERWCFYDKYSVVFRTAFWL